VAVLALVVYAAALVAGSAAVWRRPVLAVYAFVVGLALHNAVLAGLFALGLRGTELTLVAAWKEVLLAVALGRVVRDAARERRLPFEPGPVDALAVAFAALVLVYAVLPQSRLGGEADAEGVLYALRHHLVPVAAFFLGRALVLPPLTGVILATAAVVGALGILEAYLVPIDAWEDADVPRYFSEQLGFDHNGPRDLPENFVFNTGDEDDLLRRAVSTFLSPLGTAYMIVVALCLWAAQAPARWPLAVVATAGLLFTFTRAAFLALAGGLAVLAAVARRWWPALAAVTVIAVGLAWTQVYPAIAPETSWTQAELEEQRRIAEERGLPPGEVVSPDEPSIRSHLTALRDGIETVLDHPQGFGLGNSGAIALRQDVELKAGESTYTELGVDVGLLGALLFVAWNVVLFAALALAGVGGVAAAFAAVLALAIQTDVLGTPWLSYVVWILAGGTLSAWQRAT
jgi:hypothetical protein